jgi:SAM-dependent methyltransferase
MSATDREKWNNRYRGGAYVGRTWPSAFLEDWIERIPPGRALDLACGAGRNALYLAARAFDVDAVDISSEALDRARESGRRLGLRLNWLERDLDQPLALESPYQLILVVRYVNLPLIRQVAGCLAPGGFLVCEQHLATSADVIGPTNPAFRVEAGELAAVAADLRIHALEEAIVPEPDGRSAALARLVAQRI